MALKDRYVSRMEEQLAEYGARLEKFAAGSTEDARRDAALCRQRLADAGERLRELKDSGAGRWGLLRERVELAWRELNTALDWKVIDAQARLRAAR